MTNQEASDAIYARLGALPDDQYGTLNLLPFAVDNDEVNALKRKVADAIVHVLEDAGFLNEPSAPAEPSRRIRMNCRLCSTTLLSFRVDNVGVANIPAANTIETLSMLRRECPHAPMTLEDQRLLIEGAVVEEMKRGNPRDE